MTDMADQGSVPSWPSLYDPGVEILHFEHHNATQPGGHYLHHANDVFRFTLFWTLLFYTPIFVLCGSYAFLNLTFPPSPHSYPSNRDTLLDNESYELVGLPSSRIQPARLRPSKLPKEKQRRSRLAFSLLVFLTFVVLGVAGAVVGSVVLGFAAFGLYQAASFNMSTWIPFLLAILQVLVSLLSIWPSIIDII